MIKSVKLGFAFATTIGFALRRVLQLQGTETLLGRDFLDLASAPSLAVHLHQGRSMWCPVRRHPLTMVPRLMDRHLGAQAGSTTAV